jgi:hypothetical protein
MINELERLIYEERLKELTMYGMAEQKKIIKEKNILLATKQ